MSFLRRGFRCRAGTFFATSRTLRIVTNVPRMVRSNSGDRPFAGRHLVWIVLFAFAARVAVRGYTGEQDFWEHGYRFLFILAQNIAAGTGISMDGDTLTAFRVPLYPIFLAVVTFGHHSFLPVLLAQSLIGAGTVLCAALIARQLFGDTAAIIAGTLTSIYPYYVVHDTALQENCLYTFLLALAVLQLIRVRRSGSVLTAMGGGLALGAAVLTRANLAPFALLAPAWLALCGGSDSVLWWRRVQVAVICAGVAMLTVAPWLMRSDQLTGSVTLSTQSGYFLWLGNNAYTFSRYPQESIDRSQPVAFAALSLQEKKELAALRDNEGLTDEWFRKKALDYMREHPWRTLDNGFRKVVAAFDWLPSPRRSFWPSLVYALSYGPVMILGIWGMWVGRRHWPEHSIFYLQFISFAAVTAVYFGHTSYRSYLDVYWMIFAAGVLAAHPSLWAIARRQSAINKNLVDDHAF